MTTSTPWSRLDRVVVGASALMALALWLWGWFASSGSAEVADTVFGIVLGVVAVGSLASGGLSWVAAGRRAVRSRYQELTTRIDEVIVDAPMASAAHDDDRRVSVAGSNRFHRAECLLARGKKVRSFSPGATHLRRRVPCEMCQP